jgi:hypothetical protein
LHIRWREALTAGSSVAGVAVATPGADAARAAWLEAELSLGEVVDFSRRVDRPGGTNDGGTLRNRLAAEGHDGGSLDFCLRATDALGRMASRIVRSPNTASAIRKLSVSTPEPATVIGAWRRALPGSTVSSIDGGSQIRIGNHLIDLVEPQTAARRYGLTAPLDRAKAIAIDFAVNDIDACRTILARNAVPTQIKGVVTRISVDHACGVAVSMVPWGLPPTADV